MEDSWRFLVLILWASDAVQGMAVPSKSSTPRIPACGASTLVAGDKMAQFSEGPITSHRRRSRALHTPPRGYRSDWDDSASGAPEKNGIGDYNDDRMEFEFDSFQELQRSTGSEILDDELQSQIDGAAQYPNRFLDAHISDATNLEKVAMSSIPEQLPLPAVNALRRKSLAKSRNVSKEKNGLQRPSVQRVGSDEEFQLARMIQRGVRLHKIKAEYEETHCRKLSRNDWARLTGLNSATELRREVASYRRAKQLLVSANIGLVHAVVKKQCGQACHWSGLGHDELVQEGCLGLLRAAELFDPSRGLRFSTYATIWIKGALNNSHVTETIKLPARERIKWNKIVRARDELTREKGIVNNEPTIEQIAESSGLDVDDVVVVQRRMSQAKQVLSLEYEYTCLSRSGDNLSGRVAFENEKNFQSDADLVERTQMKADLIATLAKSLTPREARLMRLRYGLTDGYTRSLRECAHAMGLSETRVQQLSKECLKKLRVAAEADSLDEYLLTIA
jgi:RNA polymerase sigma factor (sigma-70 family)